jgi:hypothetical protein
MSFFSKSPFSGPAHWYTTRAPPAAPQEDPLIEEEKKRKAKEAKDKWDLAYGMWMRDQKRAVDPKRKTIMTDQTGGHLNSPERDTLTTILGA